jgi:hypothetical protein
MRSTILIYFIKHEINFCSFESLKVEPEGQKHNLQDCRGEIYIVLGKLQSSRNQLLEASSKIEENEIQASFREKYNICQDF